MQEEINNNQKIWKESPLYFVGILMLLSLLILIYHDGLAYMVKVWETREEYGYGFIIPFISVFLIWQKKDLLETIEFKGTWLGVFFVGLAVVLFYIGNLSSIFTITQYAFLIALCGAILSLIGLTAFRIIFIPLIILLFMIPLPNFFLNNLSSQLQLISSELGVAIIRFLNISVYLAGNVIDLGKFQLQVVEACSGLNYLFPLMTLAFICAYFYKGAFWKKTIVFLSSIPITVLMNSFRIGAIGILVNEWGIAQAEGFLHQFEGWAVFMSCIGILILEMWLLAKIGSDKLPLRETFGLYFPEPTPKDATIQYRVIPRQFIVSLVILTVVAASVFALPARKEIIPVRKQFSEFPMQIDGWTGSKETLAQKFITVLKFSDYTIRNYSRKDGEQLNFYSAYYDTQKKGASAHSPRSCIPGGGWRINSLENHAIKGVKIGNVPLIVNRLVIAKGDVKQLVYYWFQERGRIVTNEYMMKWYLFWDALTKSRTDGALMRLTTVLEPGEDIQQADRMLEGFSRDISPILPEYVPGKVLKNYRTSD